MRRACLLLALAACSDDPGAADAQSPTCRDVPDSRDVSAIARTYGAADAAFAGDLCVEGKPELPCAKTTDADGHFTLCGPASGAFAIRAKQSGFEPALFLIGEGAVPVDAVLLVGDDMTVEQRYYDPLAATYPPKFSTNIVLALRNADGGLANTTIQLSPDPARPVSYLDASLLLDQSLQTTSASGRAVIADAAPNSFTVVAKIGTTTLACVNQLGGGTGPFTAIGGRDVNLMLTCQ